VLLTVALCGQLWLLRRLPYSKAWLVAVDRQGAAAPREPLSLGGLHWEPTLYAAAPNLEASRLLVHEHCAGLAAFDTGRCLANFFAERFPHGPPQQEFFDKYYEPGTDLASHVAGAPGHCVTRSALVATALLAAGFPARVVQIAAADGRDGHNVLEVWEPSMGWQLLDPSFGGSIQDLESRRLGAAAIATGHFRWHRDPAFRAVVGADQNVAPRVYDNVRLLNANIVYPAPWLYTRVGDSRAPFPMQARFVVVGPRTLRLGIGQSVLQVGILLNVCAAALLCGWMIGRRITGPAVAETSVSRAKSRELIRA
jgi:hypothetical protein